MADVTPGTDGVEEDFDIEDCHYGWMCPKVTNFLPVSTAEAANTMSGLGLVRIYRLEKTVRKLER